MSPRAIQLTILRVVLVVHTLALLAQPVFAGEFLSGEDGPVRLHEVTAWFILGVCAVQIGLVAIMLRSGISSWWLLIGTVFVFLAEALQTGTGYGRFLSVHIPLGVIAFAIVLLQAIVMFRKPEQK